jgi:hypothetical protein
MSSKTKKSIPKVYTPDDEGHSDINEDKVEPVISMKIKLNQ